MTTSPDDALTELTGLLHAFRTGSSSSQILFERFVNLLEEVNPEAAYFSATALLAVGDAKAHQLGQRILRRLEDTHADLGPQRILQVRAKLPVDALVLTVKKVEFEAARDAFSARATRAIEFADGTEVWVIDVGDRRFALASIGVDGNVDSALKVGRLLHNLHPKAAFLVGTAAGVRGKTELGDVVVAEEVWAPDFAIVREDGDIPRPRTYRPPALMYTRLSTFGADGRDWPAQVAQELVALADREDRSRDYELPADFESIVAARPISHRLGVVFAGSRLIEDGSLVGLRASYHGRLLAAEMEGAGFAAALTELEFPRWLVVRGICDFGEPDRVKDWQYAATYAAATLVRDAVGAGRFPLSSGAPA